MRSAGLESVFAAPTCFFTDGSFFAHLPGRPGGWAVVRSDGMIWSGGALESSSADMELRALEEAIQRAPPGGAATIYADCAAAILQLLPQAERCGVTLRHHPEADKHPLHLAAHEAARAAAKQASRDFERGVYRKMDRTPDPNRLQRLYKRADSGSVRILLHGGQIRSPFSIDELLEAAPALCVEARRSEQPRHLLIFADGWEAVAAYLQARDGVPYCLTAAWESSDGALAMPPAELGLSLSPEFGGESIAMGLRTALAAIARSGLSVADLQQQILLREQVKRLGRLAGWSEQGPGRFVYQADGVQATMQLDLATRSLQPAGITVEVDGVPEPLVGMVGGQRCQIWSRSLRMRVGRALREAGVEAVLSARAAQGSPPVRFLAQGEFGAAVQEVAERYWERQAARVLHYVDGREQLRPGIWLWPGEDGAWRWQLPEVSVGRPVPGPLLRRVLAGYRARLLREAEHADLVAAAAEVEQGAGLRVVRKLSVAQ